MNAISMPAAVSRHVQGAKAQAAKTVTDIQTGSYRDVVDDMKKAGAAGQFAGVDSLIPLALAIVMLAVVVGVGALVLAEINNATSDADATSVLDTGITALLDFADFFTVIVVIGVAAVIFLLLSVVRRSGQAASR